MERKPARRIKQSELKRSFRIRLGRKSRMDHYSTSSRH
jgi:hypothetical protein